MDPKREKVGRGTKLGAVTAFAAVVALVTTAAGQGQYIQFEPLAYRGSPEGEPLERQDGWYVPGGASGGGDWLVYMADGAAIGIPPNPSVLRQFAAVTSLGGTPAWIERGMEFSWDMVFEIDLLLEHRGALPAPAEIGSISLEPQESRSSFSLVQRWTDPGAPERWTLEVVYYTASGERRQESPPRVSFQSLPASKWLEIWVHADFFWNQILSMTVRNKTTGERLASFHPLDWYMAGGSAGLGLPLSVRLAAGDGTGGGAMIAADNLYTGSGFCYVDCDRNGSWDFFDFLCFQNLFAAGDPYADCDASGILDFFDFLCFQLAFAGGCGP